MGKVARKRSKTRRAQPGRRPGARGRALAVLVATLAIGLLLPAIPGEPLTGKASADGGHIADFNDPNDAHAFCYLNSKRNEAETFPYFERGSYWVSCQYGPVDRTISSVIFDIYSQDLSAAGGGGNGEQVSMVWDNCQTEPITDFDHRCSRNGGGLFQMAKVGTGQYTPDTAWDDLKVYSNTCQATYEGDPPTTWYPCTITLVSKSSGSYPSYPPHWFEGGADGNAVPAGQALGSSSLHGVNPSGFQAEPVNTATGSYFTQVTDAQMPGIGIPFAFTRSYNSADATSGVMGKGWTHSYNVSLAIDTGGDVTFRGEDGQQLSFAKQSDGTFLAGPGVRDKLTLKTDGTYRITRTDQVVYKFTAAGKLSWIHDRNGQGPSFSWGGGTMNTITDSGGRTIDLTYNASDRLTKLALPDGRFVSYAYNSGLLKTVTDLAGKTTDYTYTNSTDLLKTITDQRNNTIVDNTYTAGRITQQKDALNNTATFAWDPATETSTYTDARNNQWKDVYDSGRLVRQIGPLGNETLYGYDADWNLTSVTDPRGNLTISTYDAAGNLLSRTDALSRTTNTTFDAQNNVKTVTDPKGNLITYDYDTAGNLIQLTQPGNVVTTYAHDPATGQLTAMTNPSGKTTSYTYGPKGSLTSTTDPLGNRTVLGYDSTGRLTSKKNPNLNSWIFTLDAADRVSSVIDPLGHVTDYTYFATGQVKTVTDAKGRTITYGLDANGRLTKVTAPDQTSTDYTYDAVGNLSTRTDANAHGTAYTYDAANRLTQMAAPMSTSWGFEYFANGLLKKKTLPSTDTVTYAYDVADQLTSVDYSAQNTPDVGFGYDADGNRTQMTDGAGTATYGYDALNRLTGATRGSDTFSYAYDSGNRITRRTYPDGTQIDYGYFDNDLLKTVTSGQNTTTYGYDATGNLKTATLPNGNTAAYTYDAAERLTKVENKNGSTVLSSFDQTLDNVGNPTKIVTPTETIDYTYDAQGRLKKVCYLTNCNGSGLAGIEYTYDAAGNRTSEIRYGSGAGAGTTTYNYNNADRLTSTSGPSGTTNYSYDANGNQTASGNRTFSFDAENRLLSTTKAGSTEGYTYDGAGDRLTRSADGNVQTRYQWDQNARLPMLALERDGSGSLLRRYVYGRGPGQGLVSMTSGGAEHYFLGDGQGNVVNLTKQSGTAEWSYTYEPFGTVRSATQGDPGAPENLARFNGQLFDSPTELYDLRARQFDPSTGRFLSTDPLSTATTAPYVSRYVYASNNPLAFADPSGLSPESSGGFVNWLCGGPCMVTFDETWDELYASWVAGPDIYKWIGGAMIAVSGGFLACSALFEVCAAAGAKSVTDVVSRSSQGTAALASRAAEASSSELQFTDHALRRLHERQLTIERVLSTISDSPSFRYVQEGVTKTGYYDAGSGLFVARAGDKILTAFFTKPDYVARLKG